ncbi:MAG: blue (type 1) copper domain protein [Modestobacter sp.]|jgi:plastocyanin|nr:blue (type 1) copper domain protein [Modestobacter sp.]
MSTARCAAPPAPRRGRRAPGLPAVLAGLLLVLGLLAGCSNSEPTLPAATRSPDASAGTVHTGSDGVQEITLETGDDYVFTPATFTVAPGRVRITVRNVARQLTHAFQFTPGTGPAAISEKIPVLGPGASGTIEFTVTVPGEYPFECSFHAALGQVGTMTVSE